VDYSQPISYTPKHLAEKILAARTTIEGERKQVTVLFADVKGFTSISEKLDPEEVQTMISECLLFFTEEIHRYEGAIAQFLGDGVMALFGRTYSPRGCPAAGSLCCPRYSGTPQGILGEVEETGHRFQHAHWAEHRAGGGGPYRG
jgi:class 3 adenylate cyclase